MLQYQPILDDFYNDHILEYYFRDNIHKQEHLNWILAELINLLEIWLLHNDMADPQKYMRPK